MENELKLSEMENGITIWNLGEGLMLLRYHVYGSGENAYAYYSNKKTTEQAIIDCGYKSFNTLEQAKAKMIQRICSEITCASRYLETDTPNSRSAVSAMRKADRAAKVLRRLIKINE